MIPEGYKIVIETIGGKTHWEVRDSGGHLASEYASGIVDAVITARIKAVALAAERDAENNG